MVNLDFFKLFKLWSPTKNEIKTDFDNGITNLIYKNGEIRFKKRVKITLSTDKEKVMIGEPFTLTGVLSLGKGYSIKLYNNGTLIDTLTTTTNGVFSKTITPSVEGANVYKAVFEGTDKYGTASTNLTILITSTPITLDTDKSVVMNGEYFTLTGVVNTTIPIDVDIYKNNKFIETVQIDSNGEFELTIQANLKEYIYFDTVSYSAVIKDNGNCTIATSETVHISIIGNSNYIELDITGSGFSTHSSTPFTYTGGVLVDWGDNTGLDEYAGGGLSHIYASSGSRTMKLYGEITSIGWYCFDSCTGLTSITMPDSVTSIGWWSFSGCTGLTSITIPDSVRSIGTGCFERCTALTEIALEWDTSSEIVSYNNTWISQCTSFDHFLIPQGTTNLYLDKGYPNELLKENWDILSVHISLSSDKLEVMNGEDFTLTGVVNIRGVSLSESYTVKLYDGATFIKDIITDNDGAFSETISNASSGFHMYSARLDRDGDYMQDSDEVIVRVNNSSGGNDSEDIKLSLGITGNNFTIGMGIVNLGDVLIEWGDGTTSQYKNSGVSHTYQTSGDYIINLKGAVNSISYGFFQNVKSLKYVVVGNSLTTIPQLCFADCSNLIDVSLPNTIKFIWDNCFSNTALRTINIPNSVTSLGSACFRGCASLTEIVLNWNTASEIVAYNSSWISECSSFNHFIIPSGTTSLYTAKGYPSNLLKEK